MVNGYLGCKGYFGVCAVMYLLCEGYMIVESATMRVEIARMILGVLLVGYPLQGRYVTADDPMYPLQSR